MYVLYATQLYAYLQSSLFYIQCGSAARRAQKCFLSIYYTWLYARTLKK